MPDPRLLVALEDMMETFIVSDEPDWWTGANLPRRMAEAAAAVYEAAQSASRLAAVEEQKAFVAFEGKSGDG